jgi:flagellar biosynthesis protein FlhG
MTHVITPAEAPMSTRRTGPLHPFRAMAVTSGKGGVGKTNIIVNLAIVLARAGRRVLLIDADLGLANCDLIMGLAPERDIRHLLYENAPFERCVVEGPEGVHLLAGGSGVAELTHLQPAERSRLLEAIESQACNYDTLLIDTGAGIGSNVRFFAGAAHEVIVVLGPEPTALADAYSTVKVLSARSAVKRVLVVVNRVTTLAAAREAFGRLFNLTSRFLSVVVEFAGWVPADPHVEQAVAAQIPFVVAHPMAPASQRLNLLADAIQRRRPDTTGTGGFQLFWRSLLSQGEESP